LSFSNLKNAVISYHRKREKFKTKALFISNKGGQLYRNGIYIAVTEPEERIGLHNPNSDLMEDHFSPHCCRHWFTTRLRRVGMPREFIQELRGDVRRKAIDIYDHVDKKELKESCLVIYRRIWSYIAYGDIGPDLIAPTIIIS